MRDPLSAEFPDNRLRNRAQIRKNDANSESIRMEVKVYDAVDIARRVKKIYQKAYMQ